LAGVVPGREGRILRCARFGGTGTGWRPWRSRQNLGRAPREQLPETGYKHCDQRNESIASWRNWTRCAWRADVAWKRGSPTRPRKPSAWLWF